MKLVREVADVQTGEVYKALLVGFSKPKDKGYVKIFTAFLDDILKDKKITCSSITLLLYIADKINFDTFRIQLYHKKVASDLNITSSTFYNWLNVLIEKGYIVKVNNEPYTYELKAKTVIKGSLENATNNK